MNIHINEFHNVAICDNALFHQPLANVVFMVRNTMMEDIKRYYVQYEWFKKPYKNLPKEDKTHEKSKSKQVVFWTKGCCM
jgi:hypothetical protein